MSGEKKAQKFCSLACARANLASSSALSDSDSTVRRLAQVNPAMVNTTPHNDPTYYLIYITADEMSHEARDFKEICLRDVSQTAHNLDASRYQSGEWVENGESLPPDPPIDDREFWKNGDSFREPLEPNVPEKWNQPLWKFVQEPVVQRPNCDNISTVTAGIWAEPTAEGNPVFIGNQKKPTIVPVHVRLSDSLLGALFVNNRLGMGQLSSFFRRRNVA